MANEEIGGYSFNFTESPPDEYVCLICHLVARDPQQLHCTMLWQALLQILSTGEQKAN